MKYKLVKTYDFKFDKDKGGLNSAKIDEICDLDKINKPYILNKIKELNVCLPNFGGGDKLDEEGRDYWNILVWRLDNDNHYLSAIKSIYELGENEEEMQIVIDYCESDIRVQSIIAAFSNGYITSKKEFYKLAKENFI